MSEALEVALRQAIEGEVRFDAGTRAIYACDASNFRQPPIGVVIPRTIDDVIETHRVCREYAAPVLPRGCGTSLSGEAVNHAVIIDCSKYLHQILEVDEPRRLVRVQPGAVNQKVNQRVAEHGLLFAPDPSTQAYCTIGGNVGNNSCGVHSLYARFAGTGSRTSDNVHTLDVLTYDGCRLRVGPTEPEELEAIIAAGGRRGEIYRRLRDIRDQYGDEIRRRFVAIPRRVSGYNLDELLPERGFNVARALVGTEGTCATVLEATLMLVPNPKARSLLVLGYDDIYTCADHVDQVLEHEPMGCEALDEVLFHNAQALDINRSDLDLLPDGGGWLLVEFGGDTKQEANDRCRTLMAGLNNTRHPPRGITLFDDERQARRLWQVREAGLAATSFSAEGEDFFSGWEDSAVAPERLSGYLRDLKGLYDKHGFRGTLYGHFGDGCVHTRTSFDLRSAGGVRRYRAFLEEAADMVVSHGGSLSGEHGDGQQRAELLPRMYGEPIVEAFREFKRAWDPDWKMNPGKVVEPRRLDQDLKLGPGYDPWRPAVKFSYRQDGGDFAHATFRCVGIGKCRKPDGVDVMCPSFMVLREERHTTRGRARLLFEMLDGEVIQDRWRSPEVKDALDLCLSCKGCTKDCPVHVDMPTYKAEFLHHHYEGRLRPRHAYALGLIDQACRLGAAFPGVTNLIGSTAPVARAVQVVAGVTGRRPIPTFSAVTLQRWFRARRPRNVGRPQVVVWPDTFTNHFRVQVGIAAIEAIEAAGWQVVMPEGHVCCGRPLYDYGFLDLAERYLRRSIAMVRQQVRAGIPVVGIEPSCVAVFRDELPKLLPHDDDGRRLTECASHFSEFFPTHNLEPPGLEGRALLWGHCHQKATGGIDSERALLEQMGLAVDTVTGGCCGLAGSWGFEDAHYDLSMAIGEKALLPEVRRAAATTLIVADGFSCGTQICDGGTGREALHLAQVMQLARTRRDLDAYPERDPVLQGPRRLHRFAGRTPGR